MIVTGVDPSISSTGVARIVPNAVAVQRLRSQPAGQELDERVQRMRSQVSAIVRLARGSDLIVIEGPAYGSSNQMTHMLSGFWWLMVHALDRIAPIAVVQPTTLKKWATGNGRAKKADMIAAAAEAFPHMKVRGDDEADALALAAAGALHLGIEFGAGFSASERSALAKVRWPSLREKRES
jgi:crossover junction endodeoxyribonuclease RuvC